MRLVSRKESLASGPGTASRPDWGMWRLRQSSPPASWPVSSLLVNSHFSDVGAQREYYDLNPFLTSFSRSLCPIKGLKLVVAQESL